MNINKIYRSTYLVKYVCWRVHVCPTLVLYTWDKAQKVTRLKVDMQILHIRKKWNTTVLWQHFSIYRSLYYSSLQSCIPSICACTNYKCTYSFQDSFWMFWFTWDVQNAWSRIPECLLLLRWTEQSRATLGNEQRLPSAKQKTHSKTLTDCTNTNHCKDITQVTHKLYYIL